MKSLKWFTLSLILITLLIATTGWAQQIEEKKEKKEETESNKKETSHDQDKTEKKKPDNSDSKAQSTQATQSTSSSAGDANTTYNTDVKTFTLDADIKGAAANSVNLFTGDVALPVNLLSLPGKNGLDVGVSISYSSNIDKQVSTWNLEAPTGIIGMGWSMQADKIILDHKGTGSTFDDQYYLISGGSSIPLVRIGYDGDSFDLYQAKNYQSWIIKYNTNYLFWEITKEDGSKKVYGGWNDENYYSTDSLNKKSYGNSMGWVVKWGDMIGNSNRSIDNGPFGGSPAQQQMPVWWNLRSIENTNGEKILFDYEILDEFVGNSNFGTHKYTNASYLKKITDTFGRTVNFYYTKKDSGEFIDPHSEQNEPDAYQENYETKYLDSIRVNTISGTKLLSVHFGYNILIPSSGDILMKKRVLTSITQKNQVNETQPNLQFTYNALETTYQGKLETVKYPSGGIISYKYTSVTLAKSNRELTILPPTGFGEPRVWVTDNYTIVTWRKSSTDELKIFSYTWDGRWIGKEITTLSGIGLIGVSGDTYQNFEIFPAKNFFSLVRDYYGGGQSKEYILFHKLENNPSEWNISETYSVALTIWHLQSEGWKPTVINGDNYSFIIHTTVGKYYFFIWNGTSWDRKDYSDFGTYVDDNQNYDFIVGGNHNSVIIHKTAYDDLYYLFHLDQNNLLRFDTKDPGVRVGGAGGHINFGNSSAIEYYNQGDEYLIKWEGNLYNFTTQRITAVNDQSETSVINGSIGINDGGREPYLVWGYRDDGVEWKSTKSGLPSSYKTSHYEPNVDFAEDKFIIDYEGVSADTAIIRLVDFDANNGIWESDTLQSNYGRLGYNYYFTQKQANAPFKFFYKPNNKSKLREWDYKSEFSGLINNFDRKSVVLNPNSIFTSEKYYTDSSRVLFVKNGQPFESWKSIGINEVFLPKEHDRVLNWPQKSKLTSSSTIVTFDRNVEYFRNVPWLKLSRVINDDVNGSLTAKSVDSVTVNDGYQTIATKFTYTSATASSDLSGTAAHYNEVTTTVGAGNGYTKTYFFNGLSPAEFSSSYPSDNAWTNANANFGFLTGSPYKTLVFNSQNQVVSSAENYYKIFTKQIWNKISMGASDSTLIGLAYFVRQTKSVTTTDGVATINENLFDPIDGRQTSSASYNSDGIKSEIVTTYGWQVYPEMLAKNILNVSVQTKALTNNIVTSSSVTTMKKWNGVWAPYRSYSWNGIAGTDNFTSWDSTQTPNAINWMQMNEVKKRDPLTLISTESTDVMGNTLYSVLNSTKKYVQSSVFRATGSSWSLSSIIIDLFDDYNGNVGDLASNGWVSKYGATTPEIASLVNGKLKLSKYYSPVGWKGIQKDFGTSQNQVTLDGNVIPSATNSTLYFSLFSNVPTGTYPSGYFTSLLMFFNDGTIRALTKDINGTVVLSSALMNYSAQKNYTLRITSDVLSGNWFAFIDGVRYGPFKTTHNYSVSGVRLVDNSDNSYFLIDNIRAYPSDAQVTSQLVNEEYGYQTESIGGNGETSKNYYDSFQRPFISTGLDGNVGGTGLSGYSRKESVTDTFDPVKPNWSVKLGAMGGGSYYHFDDGFLPDSALWIYGGDATPASKLWVLSNGGFKHIGVSNIDTARIPNPTGYNGPNYAIRAKITKLLGTDDYGLYLGNVRVRYFNGGYKFQFKNGSETSVSGTPGRDWLVASIDSVVYLWVDGKMIFKQKVTAKVSGSSASLYTGEPGTTVVFDDVTFFTKITLSMTYTDGAGNVRQSQLQDESNLITSGSVYDAIGRGAVQPKPTKYSGVNALFGYKSSYVTSFDWGTGSITGDANTQNSGDGGYPYSRIVFESSPLSRPIESSMPGAVYRIGAIPSRTMKTSYGKTTKSEFSFLASSADYYKQTITDQNGIVSSVVKDKMGKEILKTSGPIKGRGTATASVSSGAPLTNTFLTYDNGTVYWKAYFRYLPQAKVNRKDGAANKSSKSGTDFAVNTEDPIPPPGTGSFKIGTTLGGGDKVDISYHSTTNGATYEPNGSFTPTPGQTYYLTVTINEYTFNATGSATYFAQNVDINPITSYKYDTKGNLTNIYPPNYHHPITSTSVPSSYVSSMTYDALNRLKSKKSPDAGTIKYLYDKLGRLRLSMDSVGVNSVGLDTIKYWKYDVLGRVSEDGYINNKEWNETTLKDSVEVTTFPTTGTIWRHKYYYDKENSTSWKPVLKGVLTSVQTNNDVGNKAEVEEYYSYNFKRQLLTKGFISFGYADTTIKNTSYLYNQDGSVNQITYPTSSLVVTYKYDHLGRTSKVGTPADDNFFSEYEYDKLTSSISKEWLNNHTQFRTMTYNSQGRLTQLDGSFFTEKIYYESGGYGGVGYYNGLIAADSNKYVWSGGLNPALPSKYNVQYKYDNLNQLVTSDYSIAALDVADFGVGAGNEAKYDPNGNFLSVKVGISVKTYIYYPGTNKVQNNDGSATINYKYDANGNVGYVSSKGIASIKYDPFSNNTTSLATNGSGDNFHYSSSNQRVYKYWSSSGGVIKTLYLHGANDYPLEERNKVNSSAETVTQYIYGANGIIAQRQSSIDYYYVKDHLGSTRVVFRGSDAVVIDYYDYAAFGATARSQQTGSLVKYSYTGQERDAELGSSNGLMNYRARFYDTDLMRFYGADPAGQTLAMFNYCGNNPVSYIDKNGKFFWILIGIGALIGGYSAHEMGKSMGLSGDGLLAYTLFGALAGGYGGQVAGMAAALHTGIGGYVYGAVVASAYKMATDNFMTLGQSGTTLSFGFGSVDLSNGRFYHMFSSDINGRERLGYIYGAFSAYSAKVQETQLAKNNEWKAKFDAAEKAGDEAAKKALTDDYWVAESKLNWFEKMVRHENWIGPNGDVDPESVTSVQPGLKPVNFADKAAYVHDIGYFRAGGTGILSATTGIGVMGVDATLAGSALAGTFLHMPDIFKDLNAWKSLAEGAAISTIFTGTTSLKYYSISGNNVEKKK